MLLANAAEQGALDYTLAKKESEIAGNEKSFDSLLFLSLGLFKALGLKMSWAGNVYASLSSKNQNQVIVFEEAFRKDSDLRLNERVLSLERVKLIFQRYFKPVGSSINSLFAKKEEFGLEYSLSQIFSPKQKELFFKLKEKNLLRRKMSIFLGLYAKRPWL
ncbi:MAG: hypothetical protein HY810_05905 [Candidatus Omnitrophica bacterium]|nr:hypothetical protein [Candidatus Omnitrophota bacterium]